MSASPPDTSSSLQVTYYIGARRCLRAASWYSSVLKYMDIDTCLCEKTGGDYVIRAQTRPAIEFISGRPKSFFLVLPFIAYAFTDAWKYEDAPDPEGGRGEMAIAIPRRRGLPLTCDCLAVHQMLSLSFLLSARWEGAAAGRSISRTGDMTGPISVPVRYAVWSRSQVVARTACTWLRVVGDGGAEKFNGSGETLARLGT